MYIQYELGDLVFEWDSDKNESNFLKHGIDFETGAEAFLGPMRIDLDHRYDRAEERWRGIGLAQGNPVVVVFTHCEPSIRIISARKVERHEAKDYFQSL